MRANETMTAYMSDEDAIHDREIFVHNLGELLSQTRDGVVGCELINAEQVGEHVLVTYKGGGTRKINTHMDSYAAIVRDVAKHFPVRRTKMGKTKAEEREALRKIEQILKDFSPEDTYLGKAFEGCVEQAEENIRSDWMMSYKDRYDNVSELLHAANARVVELTKELNQKDDAIARLGDAKNQLSKELEEVKTAHVELDFKLARAKETADGLKQTILELKAKLYDVMTMEEDEW